MQNEIRQGYDHSVWLVDEEGEPLYESLTIEEKAKEFAPDCENPHWQIGMDQEAFVTLQRICFKKGYRAALTSLLDELPEVEPLNGTLYRFGRTEAISEIKSLIQTKLK